MSADVYAEFGVRNAVISSNDPREHEQNMLAMDVAVRDGDDEIRLEQPQEEGFNGVETTDNKEPEANEPETSDVSEAGDDAGEQDFEPLAEPSDELKQNVQALDEYAEGFDTMRAHAVANGLSEEAANAAEDEYERTGKLSDKTYEALAKAGYSKAFVDSYLRGQEALAESYASGIIKYAGGQEKFDAIVAHMRTNSPESLESLQAAMERKDLATVRSIINLGAASRGKKFGKSPERNVMTKAATAPQGRAKPQVAVEPFASRGEMIAAMNSKEYRLDEQFRRKVEQRVMVSSF
ncbi:hypothetical protein [Pseudomonas sp. B14(2017)]|uniref:capsid assembly protein n=1 Tax=Pseudomonas sp. B14(2017) TaxID=1981745 RepID=UPI000A1E7917|nr:hypothetical protein [Pseudomonas sp. B14(2017)]